MKNSEIKKQLKSELENKNINNFSISVKNKCFNTVIELKAMVEVSLDVLQLVENLAKKFKNIDFCLSSNEILDGGNTYVRVFDFQNRTANWNNLGV